MAMVMERGKLKLMLLLKPMLNQVIIIMATLTDMAMDMDMERGRLMLPLATIIMVMDMVDMAMDTDMERGKLMLPLDTIIMVMGMVDMAMDTDMERGRLMLPLAIIIMVMDMVDMAMDMDMERGKPPPAVIIMVMVMDMVMDTMVKQYLFISFSKFCCIHWNLLESSQQKHRPLFNPISPGVSDPGNFPGGHKVPGFNLRALNCC